MAICEEWWISKTFGTSGGGIHILSLTHKRPSESSSTFGGEEWAFQAFQMSSSNDVVQPLRKEVVKGWG